MNQRAAMPIGILEVLGNPTRRKILRVLAREPAYLLELAREVGVSQQAILKHLALLEKAGLLEAFREKSDLGPPRKYYRLKYSTYLTAGIGKNLFEMRVSPIERTRGEGVPWIEELLREIDRLQEIADPNQRLRQANDLLARMRRELRQLDDRKVALLDLIRGVRRIASETARQTSKTDIERRILYRIMGSRTFPKAESLSVELGVRIGTVEDILKNLKKTLLVREE